MNTAIYVRVSTVGQNEAGQRQEIEKWCLGNNVQYVNWYIDKESGDNLDRPQFKKLQEDIFAGRVKTVIVYKLDRLSRSLKDGINTLCEWCDRGIRVVSVTQQIDFNGAAGKLIASVLFAVAEMEQETRRERQKAGIEVAKQNGVYKGRKPGATKTNPKEAVLLWAKGLTQKQIAQTMNISIPTVQRYLKTGSITTGPRS